MVIENDAKKVPVPRGITVQRVQPSSIILSLDKLIQKQFPVTAKKVGRVAKGYYVKSLKTDPDVITITGPQTTLSQFDELFTKVINLDGVKESSQLQVPLELDSAIVELIGETSVTADLVVRLKTKTKTFESLKVDVELDGKKRKVFPDSVRVTANIPQLLLNKKTDPKSLFSITALRIDDGDSLKVSLVPRPEIELPIEVLSIIPGVVTLVDIAKGKTEDREINISAPEVKELGSQAAKTDSAVKTLKPLQSKHKN
jgi:hypothetical protein